MLLIIGDKHRAHYWKRLCTYPMNDEERMCDFCDHNGLVVRGTIFKHEISTKKHGHLLMVTQSRESTQPNQYASKIRLGESILYLIGR